MTIGATLLPTHPKASLALAAGQGLAALNFFFLDKLVKLFTQAAMDGTDPKDRALRWQFLTLAGLKLILVYGCAFALLRTRLIAPIPFAAGFTLPLLMLFLKSIMQAFGSSGTVVRRTTRTAATSRDDAKPAALLALAALLGMPAAALASGTAEQSAGGEQHLPNWVVILNDYFPHNPVVRWMHQNEYLVFAWVAGIIFLGVTWIAMRRPTFVPGQLQNGVEWVVESMEEVCGGMLGKHLERYFPFVIAIFFYILTMNLLGIVPGFKSSTSTLDLTLALALMTFVYVQFTGIRNLGILGYFDHLAGSPRNVVDFVMLPVMIQVHVMGELVKPISLSCRLFGNILGEDTLIVVFVGVAAVCLKASLVALALPPMMGVTALFMLLQTLTSIVQALIFALLTTVYLYMMLPHGAHEHGEGDHDHPRDLGPKEVTR